MKAKIVTVCNQKGGSGKTNVAMTLAAGFGLRGYSVVVVDGDPQGTATQWFASAPDDKPFPATVMSHAPAREKIIVPLRLLAAQHDIIIVDTPGALESPVVGASLTVSDLAVIPMIPAPGDLWATAQLVGIINQAKVFNDSLGVVLVPNMMQSTGLAQATLEALRSVEFAMTNSQLTLRTAYRQALAEGTSVFGTKDHKAIEEADALTNEILTGLGLAKTAEEQKRVAGETA